MRWSAPRPCRAFTPSPQGPDRWFADAKEVGLGTELELAAVRRALDLGAALPQGVYLSINVSPVTPATRELFGLITASTVPRNRLVVELTEHTGVANYPALSLALTKLRKPNPHIVKLDVDLVRDSHIDPARRALAAGLLIFADQIGASLIAEGIENEHELAALLEVGIQYGHGYHLARPTTEPLPAALCINQLLPEPSYVHTGPAATVGVE